MHRSSICSNGGVRRTWNDGISDVYFNVVFLRYLCRGLALAETGTASYPEKEEKFIINVSRFGCICLPGFVSGI